MTRTKPKHSPARKEMFQPRAIELTPEQKRELDRIKAHADQLEMAARRDYLGWRRG